MIGKPTLPDGSECWTLSKIEERRIQPAQMASFRQLIRATRRDLSEMKILKNNFGKLT
jgi:hypothetical protein